MRVEIPLLLLSLLLVPISPVRGEEVPVSASMPLVEETLRVLSSQALFPVSEEALLRAGAVRVCGDHFSMPGCAIPSGGLPGKDVEGPAAVRVWKGILESALSEQRKQKGASFDSLAFERFVADGMVEAIGDPSSFYLVPTVYRKIAGISSDFVGFGMGVEGLSEGIRVNAVYPGSPAADAGICPGDTIIEVNGHLVTGYHRPLALAAIWGADGHSLRITVRTGKQSPRKVKIVYEHWAFSPFTVQKHGEVLVVRINSFGTGLAETLKRELEGSISGLVIDLSNSVSGYDEEMLAVADLLLSEGSVGAKNMRSGLGSRVWKGTDGLEERLDLPVVVAIDGGTSGLSEVFASALREHCRAILVGRVTAGRDTEATVRPLSDGSAIQLTSIRLFGPDGAGLAEGVEPHLLTDRKGLVDLALTILTTAKGPALAQLLEAGRNALK